MQNRPSPFTGRVAAFVLALALLLVTLPTPATAVTAERGTGASPAAGWSTLVLDWLSGLPWPGPGRAGESTVDGDTTSPGDPVPLAAPLPPPVDTTTTGDEDSSDSEAYPDTDPDG